MKLALLEKYDAKTASGILAAAVLSGTPDLEEQTPLSLRRYSDEAQVVVQEVRRRLSIAPNDSSPRARSSIDRALADAIQDQFLPGNSVRTALARAGQAGRVPPEFYSVEQPKSFVAKFRTLAIRPNHIERAVKHPDDYQHPLSAEAAIQDKDVVSLFIKEATASKTGTRHWLLVQTHRLGLTQVVQSAWHIFADSLDLEKAQSPLDVLRAFAIKFGAPLEVEGHPGGLFVEGFTKKRTAQINWKFAANGDFYASLAHTGTPNPDEMQIGIGYCIQLVPYRAYLRDHGLMTTDEMHRFNREAEGQPVSPFSSGSRMRA